MKMKMKSMWRSGWDSSGGDRTDSVEPEAYKKRFHWYLFKKTLWNCMILYLFHLIFKILFFFQVLYIWTLKIIIDMHSLWPVLLSSCTAASFTVCPSYFIIALHRVFFFFIIIVVFNWQQNISWACSKGSGLFRWFKHRSEAVWQLSLDKDNGATDTRKTWNEH